MSQDKPPKAQATRGAAVPRPGPPPATASSNVEPITGLKFVTVRPASESLVDEIPASRAEYTPPPSKADALIGATVDNRYKVEAVLGEGGMGIVYRCRHKIIDKKVAMKVLRSDLARDHELTERFLMEAKAASQIGHEHIIDIIDFGLLPDESTYFVMEYLDGHPLTRDVEGQKPVPVPRILHIARQLAEGLAAAHDAGIVHRDLKPDNIFLIQRGVDKDFVKILDFGIAKVSSSSAGQLTRAGSVFGTPHYMSPEQAAGAPVDHRGDVYSFGVILYELSCGRVPFDADNFMGILTQHMYKAPVPIRALVPAPQDVPPGLEAIVLKCLSKRPEQRYGSMKELIVDIDKLRDGLVPDAVGEMMGRSGGFNVPADFFKMQGRMPAPVPATPFVPQRNRFPLVAGAVGVAVAVGLVIAIFAHSSPSPASPPAATDLAQKPAPVAPAPPPPSATAPAAPATTTVAMEVDPDDADVFLNGASLGTSPVAIQVPDGKSVDVEVRRAGYVTREITVDGTQKKLKVKLDKAPGAVVALHPHAPRPAAPKPAAEETPKPKPRPSLGGSEIVNPWGH